MLVINGLFCAWLYPLNRNISSDFMSAQVKDILQPAGVGSAAGEVTGVHTPLEAATVSRQKS